MLKKSWGHGAERGRHLWYGGRRRAGRVGGAGGAHHRHRGEAMGMSWDMDGDGDILNNMF